ncbi:MAG: hypothetical protein IKA73_00545 [Alphaproteobacteria bacterium]|nr:hypothetical protein [Alphaproteobacteria bacterium]
MKMDRLVGFMLANGKRPVISGEKWCEYDTPVYICATVDTAKQILENSHKTAIEPNPVWTMIFRVVANDIKIDKIENGLIWTRQASNIIADTPVFYKEPPKITESHLMHNAQRIMPQMKRLMNNVYRESKENQK